MRVIVLTTADSAEPFYVNPELISAFYRHKDFTMVHYSAFTGSNTWAVKETPAQIIALAQMQVIKP